MKLAYARAAAIAVAGAAVFHASTCTPRGKAPESRPPAIEEPAAPQRPEIPGGQAPPAKVPSEEPDGGTPGRRERPGPYDPLRDELQTRFAMRP